MSEQDARYATAKTSVSWEQIALSSIASELRRIANSLEKLTAVTDGMQQAEQARSELISMIREREKAK